MHPLKRTLVVLVASLGVTGCGSGCEKYASDYGCSFVEEKADYEVWYWRNVEKDDPEDERFIGRAVGLRMCEGNARQFASAIGEPWNERAYICVLIDDGKRMEKHRLIL